MDTKIALTIQDFCQNYGVGRTFVFKEIKAGRLPIKKAGQRTLILRSDADLWLSALPDGNRGVAA
ncbi:helix-turn-helix domain-containing protein [Phyllobacterium lublinensis]|uniref:helix-turn-helix domain-containing protein n=1 Tax=Phyllobacterium lublinensis TaxID=2875708 RepID=UPI001CCA035C|nr:helix-turn-helix domain-containing protein [Phyllobacterium sp. 2063]MBZ9655045.1 helix-turn-helix domain-containing protein [Phyllobacterium sp. 2063]